MTKTDIINRLTTQRNAGFLSLTDICKALGIGKDKAKTILSDTDYLELGNKRAYLVDDVAEVLLKQKRR